MADSTYIACSRGENGRCANPLHENAKFDPRKEHCTVSLAWARKLPVVACPGCQGLVPEHLGLRHNPLIIEAFKAKNVFLPRLRLGAEEVSRYDRLMSTPGVHICEDCGNWLAMLLPDGKFALKTGEALPPFVSAQDILRVERERRAVSVSAVPPTEEEAAAFRRAFAKRIQSGHSDGIKFSGKRLDGVRWVTQCSVSANHLEYCICGGWNDWREMSSIIDFHNGRAYGFGPRCAHAIALATGGNPFACTHDVAIAACKSGRPKKFIAERKALQMHRPSPPQTVASSVSLSSVGRRLADQDLPAEKPTVFKPRILSPAFSVDENAAKAEEARLECRLKHEARAK